VISPALAARLFAGLTGVVCLFQLALALGAPWGAYAMGGAFPGVFPPAMRIAAVVQIAVLAGVALVVMTRAGLVLPAWRAASHWPAWVVVGLLAVGVVLNLITPSPMERLIWAPVALALFMSALRVAASR
jgi:hypothetical protein